MKFTEVTYILSALLVVGCVSIVPDKKLAVFAAKTSCNRYIEMFHNRGSSDFDNGALVGDESKIGRLRRLGYAKALKKNDPNCENDAVEVYEVVYRDGSQSDIYVAKKVKPISKLETRTPHNFGLIDSVLGEVMLIEPKNVKAFK